MKMRFIFVGFPDQGFPEMLLVAKTLREQGHRIVHWIRASGFAPTYHPDLASFVDFRWDPKISDTSDPLLFLDTEQFPPLDAQDLLLLASHESTALDLLHRVYAALSVPELMHYYHLYLRCWKGFFETLKPDVIVFRTIPHDPMHFIIYIYARARGIKTLIFYQTWFGDRILPMEDFTQGVEALRAPLAKDDRQVTLADLSSDLQALYRSHSAHIKDATPFYMPDALLSYTFFGRLRLALRLFHSHTTRGALWRRLRFGVRAFFHWFRTHLRQDLPRAYARLESSPDFTKSFIYFPLHFQPEPSTSPLGGPFRDQLLALEILVATLPKDWLIYVKEHPTEWPVNGTHFHSYRYSKYYEAITRFPNVRLVPIQTDTFKLTSHAKAVATITGTAGWEAILRGKPALIFGYPWYMFASGVFRVSDIQTCRMALQEIAARYTLDTGALFQFLKHFDDASFRGCLDLHYRTNPNFFTTTSEEQASNILKFIL